MNKIQSFQDFSAQRNEKLKLEQEKAMSEERQKDANIVTQTLEEFGATKVADLTEEQKEVLISKLTGKSTEVNEGRFYAFHKGQKHEIEADSMWKAKQKAITDLKVKKKDVGLLAVVNADQHDDFSSGKNADFAFENELNEADIKSADEFKEYAFDTLKKAFGDDFDEAKAQDVVDGILDKCGDDYGTCVGMLNKSLGS